MKRGDSLTNEDIILLKQLIQSSEEAFVKLDFFYKNKNYENFVKVKNFILHLQKKISEVLQ